MIGVIPSHKVNRYTPSVKRVVRAVLSGVLVGAVLSALSLSSSPLTPPAYAEMAHNEGPATQDCLVGCMMSGGSLIVQILTVNQRFEEEKDRDLESPPYHIQFFRFYMPLKITPRYEHIAYILRPPDLVVLNTSYLS